MTDSLQHLFIFRGICAGKVAGFLSRTIVVYTDKTYITQPVWQLNQETQADLGGSPRAPTAPPVPAPVHTSAVPVPQHAPVHHKSKY